MRYAHTHSEGEDVYTHTHSKGREREREKYVGGGGEVKEAGGIEKVRWLNFSIFQHEARVLSI